MIVVEEPPDDKSPTKKDLSSSSTLKQHLPRLRRIFSPKKSSEGGKESGGSGEQTNTLLDDAVDEVRQVSDSVYYHLVSKLHHYGSTFEGKISTDVDESLDPSLSASSSSSSLSDSSSKKDKDKDSDGGAIHFAYNDSSIIGIYPLSNGSADSDGARSLPLTNEDTTGEACRLVIRDKTGKYAWDVGPLDTRLIESLTGAVPSSPILMPDPQDAPSLALSPSPAPPQSDDSKVEEGGPENGDQSGSASLSRHDILLSALSTLEEKHSREDLLQIVGLTEFEGEFAESIEKMRSLLLSHSQGEKRLQRPFQDDVSTRVSGERERGGISSSETWVGLPKRLRMDMCRFFLSQLYLDVTVLSSRSSAVEEDMFRLTLLNESEKLTRSLRLLDDVSR